MKASLNSYRQSPRKVRLVSDLVKGKPIADALRLLSVTTKAAAHPLRKLIESAVKSAKDQNVSSVDLYVKDFRVDAGATLKRSMPRARGSAFPILKRTCRVSLVLEERERPNEKVKAKNSKEIEKPAKK